jgi:hypothetical protein
MLLIEKDQYTYQSSTKKVSLGWIYIAITQSLFIAVVKKQSRLKELEQIITPLYELVHYVRFN